MTWTTTCLTSQTQGQGILIHAVAGLIEDSSFLIILVVLTETAKASPIACSRLDCGLGPLLGSTDSWLRLSCSCGLVQRIDGYLNGPILLGWLSGWPQQQYKAEQMLDRGLGAAPLALDYLQQS